MLAALVYSVKGDHEEPMSWLRYTPPGQTEKQMEVWNLFESTFSDAFENSVLSILLKTADEGVYSWWV